MHSSPSNSFRSPKVSVYPGLARAQSRSCRCHASTGSNIVVGVGGVGIDYLASVATFPSPDQKTRTEELEIQGGGNCGNAMTGVARLGVTARVLSMIGTDPLGDKIMESFEADRVSTQFLQRISTAPTPFTYIIVDRAGVRLLALIMPPACFWHMHNTTGRAPRTKPDRRIVYPRAPAHHAAAIIVHFTAPAQQH